MRKGRQILISENFLDFTESKMTEPTQKIVEPSSEEIEEDNEARFDSDSEDVDEQASFSREEDFQDNEQNPKDSTKKTNEFDGNKAPPKIFDKNRAFFEKIKQSLGDKTPISKISENTNEKQNSENLSEKNSAENENFFLEKRALFEKTETENEKREKLRERLILINGKRVF